MDAKLKPSAEVLVVRVAEGEKDDVSHRLARLGAVEDLKGGLLLLRAHVAPKSPRENWRRARKLMGADAFVQPALVGESGDGQYPTGEIAIRFHETQTDAYLKKFAKAHGLRLLKRNDYVPQQAAYQLDDAGSQYLPDLVSMLEQDEKVKSVWPDTLAHFKRA
ncbi:MAG: hypothetical protein ACRD9R_18480 [Pyrinomonadaceae bacterium]